MVNGTQDLLSIDRVRIRNASNNNKGVLHTSKVLISFEFVLLHLISGHYIAVQTSNVQKVQKILPLTKLIYLPKLTQIKD